MYKYYAACKVELQPFNQTVVLTADVFQLFIKTHPIGNTYSEYNSVMYTRYQVHIITPLQLSYASRHTRVPQLKCVIVTHPSGNTNCADHSGLDTYCERKHVSVYVCDKPAQKHRVRNLDRIITEVLSGIKY